MTARLEAIKKLLLHDWDPIGISDVPQAADEYDSYAEELRRMLDARTSVQLVTKYLDQIVAERMMLAVNSTHNRQIAEKAADLWAGYVHADTEEPLSRSNY